MLITLVETVRKYTGVLSPRQNLGRSSKGTAVRVESRVTKLQIVQTRKLAILTRKLELVTTVVNKGT
jgi:hypothetical protein